MAGSLNIAPGASSIWTATTALNGLCPSQTKLTVTGWIKINSFAPTDHVIVFANNPASGFQVLIDGFSNLKFNFNGMSYSWPIRLGQSLFFAMTLDTSSVSHIWINGTVAASASGLSAIAATPTAIQFGWASAGAVDYIGSDLAIYSAFTMGQPDILGLRDRTKTPLTTSTPATSWWTLQGTAGAHPTTADAGLHDQIGANHFTTIAGTTTAATYSATEIDYVPPVTVSALITRSGNLIRFMAGSNPAVGNVVPTYITAINALPTVLVNGSAPQLQGPFWSSVNHQHPHLSLQIIGGVAPTDVVTWTTPDAWLTTPLGSPADDSGTALNCVGGDEPGYFGYIGSNPPDGWEMMQVGFDGPGGVGGPISMLKNAVHRVQTPWFNAATSDPVTGYPLTIGSALSGTSNSIFWSADTPNGIDARQMPVPTGTWTVLADETNDASPMIVFLSTSLSVSIDQTNPNPLTHPTITGTGNNKKWEFSVNYVANPATFNPPLVLNIQTPNGLAGPNTLRNIRVFEPGNAPINQPEQVCNGNLAAMCTAEPDVYASVVRFMQATAGNDGAGSYVFPSDLPPLGRFGYNLPALVSWPTWTVSNPTYAGNRTIPVYQFRKYDVSVSPNVYSPQQYARTIASDNPQAGAFMWRLADLGLGYDWGFHGADYNSSLVPVEVVCADNAGNRINHNFQTGQPVGLPAAVNIGGVTVADDHGHTGVMNTAIYVFIYVTSPSTFMFVQSVGNLTNTNKMGFVVGGPFLQQTAGVNSSATSQTTGSYAPRLEDIGCIGYALPGMGLWVAVNHAMNDDGVRAQATRLFNSSPRGTKFFVQWSNEICLDNTQKGWANQLASIEGFREPDTTTGTIKEPRAVIQRTFEVHNVFADVFGSDSASIVRLFQPFVFDPGGTTDALKYAQDHSIPIDGIATAAYIDMDFSPTFKMAAAMTCVSEQITISGTPTHVSIANPDNDVPPNGISSVLMVHVPGALLPMAAYHELVQPHLKYSGAIVGAKCAFSIARSCAISAGYGAGGGAQSFVYPFPKIMGYEDAPSTMIPPGVSTQAKVVRAGLTHDFVYNPAYYDTYQAFLQYCQQPGPAGTLGADLICVEAMEGSRQSSPSFFVCNDGPDNTAAECWQQCIYQTQQPGTGSDNLYWASDSGGDGLPHDVDNESVVVKSVHDWIIEASGHIIPPVASFVVSPATVSANHASPITLTLVGTATTWTGGSTVTITNSLTGTTSVTAGTFTAVSSTSATLQVTTGAGNGTWRLTIDGTNSASLSQGGTRRRWTSRMGRRLRLST